MTQISTRTHTHTYIYTNADLMKSGVYCSKTDFMHYDRYMCQVQCSLSVQLHHTAFTRNVACPEP